MKNFLPLLLLLAACGKTETSKIPVEPPRIRELSLEANPDGSSETKDLMPSCDQNCKLWRVEKPEEDVFFCLQQGWLPLGDYVGPDETMYCRI